MTPMNIMIKDTRGVKSNFVLDNCVLNGKGMWP